MTCNSHKLDLKGLLNDLVALLFLDQQINNKLKTISIEDILRCHKIGVGAPKRFITRKYRFSKHFFEDYNQLLLLK